jgi:integrase
VAIYTGTRAGAICGAAFKPSEGRGWVDLESGIFHRRPPEKPENNKRQPPVRLSERLLAHLRRWANLGLSRQAVVEWHGVPVKRINKAFRSVGAEAGLGPEVVPHVLRHTCATWAGLGWGIDLGSCRLPRNERSSAYTAITIPSTS